MQVHLRWATDLPSESEAEAEQSSSEDDREREQEKQEKDVSPYVSVSVGPAANVTSVAEKSKHAQWRETFFLNVRWVSLPAAASLLTFLLLLSFLAKFFYSFS